jgi:hypothetical protein
MEWRCQHSLVKVYLILAHIFAQSFDQEASCDTQERAVSLLQTSLSHSSKNLQQDAINSLVHVAYVTSMNSTGAEDFGLMAALLSASRTIANPGKLVIHLIVPPSERGLAAKFVQCFAAQFRGEEHPTVHLYGMQPVRAEIGHQKHALHLEGCTETYVRWYLGEYLTNVSRVIYIDTDTIVQDDLTQLYNMDLKDNIIAAKFADYTLSSNYPESLDAINSTIHNSSIIQAGVLLMDLDRWRSNKVLEVLENTTRELVEINNGVVDDQLALTIVFHQNFKATDFTERWNNEGPGYMHGCLFTVEMAGILHWSGSMKAWDYPPWYPCSPFTQNKPKVACPA